MRRCSTMTEFFPTNADLFAKGGEIVDVVRPWMPRPLSHDEWARRDYRSVYAWRMAKLKEFRQNPSSLESAIAYYRTHKAEFIWHWMDTYNPRLEGAKWVPFIPFKRQDEFLQFIAELDRDQVNGLVEKCRDVGATWLLCGWSVACWLFDKDDATGWGSRKESLVDTLGDPDSIFEKMRLIVRRLPKEFLPKGFSNRNHATFMKMVNPENGSTITGESGDNIGRGGRKKRYVKDESAHYERPEKIQAALDDNTNVQIDISSVNGLGNVFHRKRESGIDWSPGKVIDPAFTRVFVFDWRDHPDKTQAWYDMRKAKAEREGMQHIFAQEVDRNYSAAVTNTVIPYEWLVSCIDAHLVVPCLRVPPPNQWMAGLDLADEGLDRNAQALRQWVILREVDEWGERDPGVSVRRSIYMLRNNIRYKIPHHTKTQYDSIGIGSNVKSEYNRWNDEGLLTKGHYPYVAWNAGAAVQNPFDHVIPDDDESLLNGEHYQNLKAQAWWSFRSRVYKTHLCVTQGAIYPADDLVSFDSDGLGEHLYPTLKELAQVVSKPSAHLKTMIDKKPNGVPSPNKADAVIMAYFPADEAGGQTLVGRYS